ncbi:MAG: hypothetical protein ACKVS9_12905 [Phycisphaerae bacterium]
MSKKQTIPSVIDLSKQTTFEAALESCGIQWESAVTLAHIHAVAKRSCAAAQAFVKNTTDSLARRSAPDETVVLQLLRAVVEGVLLPDRLPTEVVDSEALELIFWEFQDFERKRVIAQRHLLEPKNPWSVRSAVQAVWSTRISVDPGHSWIASVAATSAHWMSILIARELWIEHQLIVHPLDGVRLAVDKRWREFQTRWCNQPVPAELSMLPLTMKRELQKARHSMMLPLRAIWGQGPDAVPLARTYMAWGQCEPPPVHPSELAESQPNPTQKPVRRSGRPRLSLNEAIRRRDIVEDWKRAAQAGVSRAEFAKRIGIDVKTLERYLSWDAAQQRRRGRPTKPPVKSN